MPIPKILLLPDGLSSYTLRSIPEQQHQSFPFLWFQIVHIYSWEMLKIRNSLRLCYRDSLFVLLQ
jgi:hypothetical protein